MTAEGEMRAFVHGSGGGDDRDDFDGFGGCGGGVCIEAEGE